MKFSEYEVADSISPYKITKFSRREVGDGRSVCVKMSRSLTLVLSPGPSSLYRFQWFDSDLRSEDQGWGWGVVTDGTTGVSLSRG